MVETESGWVKLVTAIRKCRLCEIARTKNQYVIGRGNAGGRWLIVGEAPGESEDRSGLPFVGKAGRLLEEMLSSCLPSGMLSQIYVTNVLKCRTPHNRKPHKQEKLNCSKFLREQIELVGPDIIVALGSCAAETLLGTGRGISKVRGDVRLFEGIPVVATYHPAHLLRTPVKKGAVLSDFCSARSVQAFWSYCNAKRRSNQLGPKKIVR